LELFKTSFKKCRTDRVLGLRQCRTNALFVSKYRAEPGEASAPAEAELNDKEGGQANRARPPS
jgi:hypothetical protein